MTTTDTDARAVQPTEDPELVRLREWAREFEGRSDVADAAIFALTLIDQLREENARLRTLAEDALSKYAAAVHKEIADGGRPAEGRFKL